MSNITTSDGSNGGQSMTVSQNPYTKSYTKTNAQNNENLMNSLMVVKINSLNPNSTQDGQQHGQMQ